jgi:hypothetical protein
MKVLLLRLRNHARQQLENFQTLLQTPLAYARGSSISRSIKSTFNPNQRDQRHWAVRARPGS